MGLITVKNTDRENEYHLRSADGDSMQINPNAKLDIDEKFAWGLKAVPRIKLLTAHTITPSPVTPVVED